jgi:hypothetical protein
MTRVASYTEGLGLPPEKLLLMRLLARGKSGLALSVVGTL